MFIDFIIIFKNNYKKFGRIIKCNDYNANNTYNFV